MAELDKVLERQHSNIKWVDTERQNMFSDAVFSIVATIMVVTVEIGEEELDEVSVTSRVVIQWLTVFSNHVIYDLALCILILTR